MQKLADISLFENLSPVYSEQSVFNKELPKSRKKPSWFKRFARMLLAYGLSPFIIGQGGIDEASTAIIDGFRRNKKGMNKLGNLALTAGHLAVSPVIGVSRGAARVLRGSLNPYDRDAIMAALVRRGLTPNNDVAETDVLDDEDSSYSELTDDFNSGKMTRSQYNQLLRKLGKGDLYRHKDYFDDKPLALEFESDTPSDTPVDVIDDDDDNNFDLDE